jgi:hypothetical protein
MFERGDFVHIVDEPSNIGVVMEIVDPGLPKVRFGTSEHAHIMWPHDLVKVNHHAFRR